MSSEMRYPQPTFLDSLLSITPIPWVGEEAAMRVENFNVAQGYVQPRLRQFSEGYQLATSILTRRLAAYSLAVILGLSAYDISRNGHEVGDLSQTTVSCER